jgi:prepilin-type N-terminal cleavage/methylation domain-containing protein
MLRVQTYNLTGSRGFTLVEVLVSLACMAIAFVGIWSLHFSSVKMDARNQQETAAINMANSELERLRSVAQSKGYSTLLSEPTGEFTDQPSRGFTLSRTISVDTTFPWRATITIGIAWKEKTGGFGGPNTTVQRRVQMATIIADLA